MKVTIDASKELQTNPGWPIEYEVTPQYLIGHRFRHYATGDVYMGVGYCLTTRLWTDEDARQYERRELRYITQAARVGQVPSKHETAASTIARCQEVQA